ncbi:hypothetical protein A2Z00_02610 [Candidatus Gottesmanbacteria bacterium RBG_13_45_10]|uniref:Uncharacterized protein n=1 Tax=Candidatus Gottesmanbacteria bacterium RBG_13_45_10 TaxID=1798370 RepID=A0A1F5ZGS7_9BACT|nr:MAG: hypothetical protein A2Z00_02610 [Candidatus Gottesmanbacteria bacterium RBG_13_45_10]
MRQGKNLFLLGSVGLIILAIALVAILDRTKSPSTSSTDVRARAATSKTLVINAIVDSIDQTKNEIIVSGAYFSDQNRSGEAKNLGTWIVTPPYGFDFLSIFQGSVVAISIDPVTFMASSHTLNALSIVPVK